MNMDELKYASVNPTILGDGSLADGDCTIVDTEKLIRTRAVALCDPTMEQGILQEHMHVFDLLGKTDEVVMQTVYGAKVLKTLQDGTKSVVRKIEQTDRYGRPDPTMDLSSRISYEVNRYLKGLAADNRQLDGDLSVIPTASITSTQLVEDTYSVVMQCDGITEVRYVKRYRTEVLHREVEDYNQEKPVLTKKQWKDFNKKKHILENFLQEFSKVGIAIGVVGGQFSFGVGDGIHTITVPLRPKVPDMSKSVELPKYGAGWRVPDVNDQPLFTNPIAVGDSESQLLIVTSESYAHQLSVGTNDEVGYDINQVLRHSVPYNEFIQHNRNHAYENYTELNSLILSASDARRVGIMIADNQYFIVTDVKVVQQVSRTTCVAYTYDFSKVIFRGLPYVLQISGNVVTGNLGNNQISLPLF
jgi:hypothetical protein